MIAFVLIATAMVAIAVACVVVPLLLRAKPAGIAGEASNVAILRDQLAELDADLATGTMPQAQYDEARRELERRVLDESRVIEHTAAAPSQSAAWTAALLGSAVPIAALLLYVVLGNHEAFAPAAPRDAKGSGHEVTRADVEAMVAKLSAKLEQEPNNPEGWVMLARTYYVLKRNDDATRAFERAVALSPDNADLLADYADALGATQGGMEGKPLELVMRALAVDPTHWKALALAGTAAFDRKDYKQAVAYWEKIKTVLPADSPILASIDSGIAEARSLGGMAPGPGVASSAPSATASAGAANAGPNSVPAPSVIAQSSAAKNAKADAGASTVAGTVSLSPDLAARVSPTDTVYVFARAAQGPRMPLAILKKQVKDLPITFKLDDSMAMAPNLALSGFPEVVVGARISKSGNATPQSGDLEGVSPTVKTGATGVGVVIDRAHP